MLTAVKGWRRRPRGSRLRFCCSHRRTIGRRLQPARPYPYLAPAQVKVRPGPDKIRARATFGNHICGGAVTL
jgi:hypothetical protein